MQKKIMTSLALGMFGVGFMALNAMALPYGNGPSLIDPGVAGVIEATGQPTLQTIVNNVFGSNVIDVNSDQTGIGGWTKSENDTSSYLVTYALGTSPDNPYIPGNFGIYDLHDSSKSALLFATDAVDSYGYRITNANFEFTDTGRLLINNVTADPRIWSGDFGFYFEQLGTTRYTEDSRNGNANYAAAYRLADGTTYDTSFYLGNGGTSGTALSNNDWLLAFEYNPLGAAIRDFNDGVFIVEDMKAVPEPSLMLLFGTGLTGLVGIASRRRKQ